MDIKTRNEQCVEFFDQCLRELEYKSETYNPGGRDAYEDFRIRADVVGLAGPLAILQVIALTAARKIIQIKGWLQGGASGIGLALVCESLMDLANYCAILWVWLREIQAKGADDEAPK